MRLTSALAAAATLLCTLLSAQSPATAEDAAQTMLLIDGSGSMWGNLDPDKRAKIDIARDVLQSKIAASGSYPIGLASFGHRRKGDCSDVEVLVPPATDHAVLSEALLKLNPRGKGPLAAALRAAVAGLGPQRPANLIVVNDGVDNCRQDACAAAAEIAQASPGVAIHMIAIGIEPAGKELLSCVARATRGSFHDVSDSTELVAAIDTVATLAMRVPASTPGTSDALPPTPAIVATPTDAGLQAKVALADGGSAINLPVQWSIFQSGRNTLLAESTGPSITARLDPGAYDIEAAYGRLQAKQTVTVEAGQTANIVLPFNAGRLKVATKGGNALQPPPSNALLIAVEPMTDGKPQPQETLLVNRSTLSDILPAGTYTVTLTDGPIRQSKSITLAAGAETAVDFTTSTGRLELSAGLREDGGAIEDVTFSISEDDPDSPDGRREVARSRAPSPTFTLPAGTYYASAHSGDGEVRQRIAVGAGDVVKRALILPLVPVKVRAQIGANVVTATQGIAYRVTALDGDRRELVRSVKPELALALLPGRYRISAHLDAHHLKVAEEVMVEAGQGRDVILTFVAGEVSFKLGPGLSAGLTDTSWQIIDSSGKRVWRTTATAATALLAPGRYTVHLDRRDQHTEAAFEVRSGEQKVVEIGTN